MGRLVGMAPVAATCPAGMMPSTSASIAHDRFCPFRKNPLHFLLTGALTKIRTYGSMFRVRNGGKIWGCFREGAPARVRWARAIFRHPADRKETRPIPLNSTWFHLIPVNSTSRPWGGVAASPPPITNDRFSIPNSHIRQKRRLTSVPDF